MKAGMALLHRVAAGLGCVLIANLVVVILLQHDLLHAEQAIFNDLLLRQSAGQQALGPIVIAAIDGASLKAYGPADSWDRGHYADLIRNARTSGARAVAFDVPFSHPAPGDDALAAAIDDSMRPKDGTAPMAVILGVLGTGQPHPTAGKGLAFTSFQEVAPAVARGRPVRAALNLQLDGGSARELAMNAFSGAEQYQPLALIAADAYAAGSPELKGGFRLETSPARIGFGCAADTGPCTYEIPTDEYFQVLIAYETGPGGYAPQAISLASIAEGRTDPAALKDRIVFVGAFPSADGYPVPTSADATMPRVEIWANVAESLLSGRFIAPQPVWPTAATMLVLSLAAVGFVLRFGALGFIGALSLALLASGVRSVVAAAQLAAPAAIGHAQVATMPEFVYVDAAAILSSAAAYLCVAALSRGMQGKAAVATEPSVDPSGQPPILTPVDLSADAAAESPASETKRPRRRRDRTTPGRRRRSRAQPPDTP